MLQVHSIRILTIFALGLISVIWAAAQAEQHMEVGAPAVLEVRVLDVQPPSLGPGEDSDLLYRMEVISVRQAASKVEPGDTILVRSFAPTAEAGTTAPPLLNPGWMGIAYLKPDPDASGPEAAQHYTIAANSSSFEDLPPAPPSLRYTREVQDKTE